MCIVFILTLDILELVTDVSHLSEQRYISQGLTYFDGHVYEGTGMEQESCIMRHDPSDGMRTIGKVPLAPANLFGEGISHYYVWKAGDGGGDRVKEHRIIQITWKNRVGKIYSLPDLEVVKEFTFNTSTGEGWGISFIPRRNEFVVSDGSEHLMFWDAETLEEKRRVAVTWERAPGEVLTVRYVNELEFVDFNKESAGDAEDSGSEQQCAEGGVCEDTSGPSFTPTEKILANIWYQDVLVAIDPDSGKISRVYDLMDIYPKNERRPNDDCLNGISVTGSKGDDGLELWVTGKLWPKMYRIRLKD